MGQSKISVSRRGFLKGAVAAGTAAALYGCSKGNDGEVIYSGSMGGGTTGTVTIEETSPVEKFYGAGGHNCGGRCISQALVQDGRIVRIISDEHKYTKSGAYIDPESRNYYQRPCARCRAYRYRIYHPGRLRYPVKQMKQRGDLNGFVRISWEQAYKEIAAKHKAVIAKYGVDGVYQIYACGSVSSTFNGAQSGAIGKTNGYAVRGMDGARTPMFGSYSTHQYVYFGEYYTGQSNGISNTNPNNLAKYSDHVVLWGDNSLTTGNSQAYAAIKSIEDMKKLRPDAKVIYVGPEFVDTGVTLADEWIVSKPFSDTALVAGMIYHMLDNTFDLSTGKLKSDPWLDVDYLDTLVYGFFDSPGYYIDTISGEISGTPFPAATYYFDSLLNNTVAAVPSYITALGYATPVPGTPTKFWAKKDSSGTITPDGLSDTYLFSATQPMTTDTPPAKDTTYTEYSLSVAKSSRTVPAVPAGRSYCSWILGNNNNAVAYSDTTVANNYTATKYEAIAPGTKRWASCTYDGYNNSNTKYETKRQYTTPKTPKWAEEITGVPEAKIKELAELYAKGGRIATRWAYAIQKQAEALSHMFAHQALHIITKNTGTRGAGLAANTFGWPKMKTDKGLSNAAYNPWGENAVIPTMERPSISCTAWHTAIKLAYKDELTGEGGKYTHAHIPNYAEGTKVFDTYWDDGGTKAYVQWKRNPDGTVKTYQEVDENGALTGQTLYDWEGRDESDDTTVGGVVQGKSVGTPVRAGIRLLYNPGGNIMVNQHENTNDTAEMLASLPLCNYEDADSFCLVSIDNFMSATPRYSDYVLPGSTYWEQQDIVGPYGMPEFYTQQVITPPGESKPIWDIGRDLLKTYLNMGGSSRFGSASKVIEQVYPEGESVEEVIKKRFDAADAKSPLKNMTWEEYKKDPVLPGEPDDFTEVVPDTEKLMQEYEARKANGLSETPTPGAKTLLSDPLVKPGITNYFVNTADISNGGYGNQFSTTANAPDSPKRYQVYSPVLVWQYENKFSKWHGFLPANQRGQQHKDLDGDRFVIEIPVYYAYQDHFMEAYALNSTSEVDSKYPFRLITTHDRYRSHSSLAENPILRELCHYVPGQDSKGNMKQANDAGFYAMPPDTAPTVGSEDSFPYINRLIGENGAVEEKNKEIVSYSEIWMNKADGAARQIKSGDLIDVTSGVGTVRCVAHLSTRVARGVLSLHQGAWYDPRTIGGKNVDVGGCVNTLMASQPSRIDHGNGQQSAMVNVTKVNY